MPKGQCQVCGRCLPLQANGQLVVHGPAIGGAVVCPGGDPGGHLWCWYAYPDYAARFLWRCSACHELVEWSAGGADGKRRCPKCGAAEG